MSMGKYEPVKCIICNANNEKLWAKRNGFNVVQCRQCGLVYVNPRLTPKALIEMYNENKISPKSYYVENIEEDRKTFRNRIKIIEMYKKTGRLLDVGCAIGTFMDEAKKRGWDVYGLDINKSAIEYCRDKLKLNAKVSKIEDSGLKKESFDVIVMNDFLEHVPDPVFTVKEANKLLKKDGIVFIVTPNIGSILANLTKSRWLHLKPDEHIYYYNPRTIKILLNKANLKFVRWKPIGRVRNLEVIAYKSQSYSKIPYAVLKALGFLPLLRRISFNLNPLDEMMVIAKK